MTQQNDARSTDQAGEAAADGAPQGPEAREVAEPAPEQDLQRQLEEARAQAQQHWDQYLRTAAELDNLRRRSAQELEKARKFAIERFAGELLNVRDSLEMGLAAAAESPTVETLREGTEATLKQLDQVFARFDIAVVDPQGEPFDPTLHEAISVQELPGADSEQVSLVVQKGYTLNDRLLRPARVIVARPGNVPDEQDETS